MTCIVGITDGKKVYMGGDSQGTAGWSKTMMKNEKVFKKTFFQKTKTQILQKEMIFGCSGSVRMTQILHYIFTIPEMDDSHDEREYMVKTFLPELIKCFSDNGFLKTISGEISNCYFMCGFNGKIFSIYDDFQVCEPSLNYYAMGHGKDQALGSMFASFEYHDKDYVNILTNALKASSAFDVTVDGPFNILIV